MDVDPVKLIPLLINIVKEGFKKNANVRVTHKGRTYKVMCTNLDCKFSLRFRTQNARYCYILDTAPHTCKNEVQITPKIPPFLINIYISNIVGSFPLITAHQISEALSTELGIPREYVKKANVYQALKSIKRQSLGNNTTYSLLEDYADKYRSLNNAAMKVITGEDNRLAGVYIEFKCSKQYCSMKEKLLLLDGTHQKTSFKSTILVLAGTTSFGTVIPLAFLWCTSESKETTDMLLDNAKDMIGDEATFKSDAAQAFISAIKERGYKHSLCTYHLYAKLKKKGILILKDMKNAQTQSEFTKLCKELQTESPSTWKKVCDRMQMYFRLAGEPKTYCNDGSGAIESLNHMIDPARKQEFVFMFNELINCVNKQIDSFKKIVIEQSSSPITVQAENLIKKRVVEGQELFKPQKIGSIDDMILIPKEQCYNKDQIFRIYREDGRLKCTCNESAHSGLPCIHMCSVLSWDEIIATTSEYWKVESYRWALSITEHNVPIIEELTPSDLELPDEKRQQGRPRIKRWLSTIEIEKCGHKNGVKKILKEISEDINDIELSMMDLHRLLLYDEMDYGSVCYLIISKIKETEASYKRHHECSNCITKRAHKSIEIYTRLETRIRVLSDFIYTVFNDYKDAILQGFAKSLTDYQLLGRLKLINELEALQDQVLILNHRVIMSEILKYIK